MSKFEVITFVERIPRYERYGISEIGEVYDFQNKMFINIRDRGNGYLCVNLRDSVENKKMTISIHKLLAICYIPNPANLPFIDHIDRNTLNNAISNLRWCTNQTNQMNKQKSQNKSSKYKGVYWNKRKSKWQVGIKLNGKSIFLGLFQNEDEAALAYNSKALELFKEFACPNIIS